MAEEMKTHWQLQEAKQRFSEVVRAAESRGTQFVTRHGGEVVAVVPIQEYRRMVSDDDFVGHLLTFPVMDEDASEIFDEIIRDRKNDLPREIDLGADE